MSTSIYPLVSFTQSWRISGMTYMVAQDVTANATDYWTIRAQIVRAHGEIETLGTISTATKSLAMARRYDLFAPVGLAKVVEASPGDLLRLTLEEGGTGPPLLHPIVTVKRRRE